MSAIERRFSFTELRAVQFSSAESPGRIVGYAATWAGTARIGDFLERVDRHCFDKSLTRGDKVIATVGHDPNRVIGSTKNKTLALTTDERGLRSDIVLPNTSVGRDILENVRRGDVGEMSFGFQVEGDDGEDWDWTDDPDDRSQRIRRRTLKNCRLLDVALTPQPAYDNTSAWATDGPLPDLVPFRSIEQLFPAGIIPAEIRSHAPDVLRQHERRRAHALDAAAKRRRLVNSVLSI
ncbi:MAG TPA: HK97 family phage prohead protease [Candidatus Acidoferrum sp.]|nr:HK97 family phage prohead protease [Candidatus Acidoferrum sp.]